MKRLIVSAIISICATAAMADVDTTEEIEEEETSFERGDARIMVGGFARGGMRMKSNWIGHKKEFFNAYGADMDFQFKTLETEDFNLWADLGFSWAPDRTVFNKKKSFADGPFYYGTHEKASFQYGQLRFMLVPEWQVTEKFAVGARLGAGLNWTRIRVYRGGFEPNGSWGERHSFSKFGAEAIAGLQATYMFTENLGVYANIDARMGEKMQYKKYGRSLASVDMSGWYAGAGMVVTF